MAFLPVLVWFLAANVETIIDNSSFFFFFRIAISGCHSNIPEDSLLDLMAACQGVALSITVDFPRLYWEFSFRRR